MATTFNLTAPHQGSSKSESKHFNLGRRKGGWEEGQVEELISTYKARANSIENLTGKNER